MNKNEEDSSSESYDEDEQSPVFGDLAVDQNRKYSLDDPPANKG